MKEILGYCGYRCDLCPAHKGNIRGPDDQKRTAEAWLKYYDLKIEPEEIYCDGCLEEGGQHPQNCNVRPCARKKGYVTCSECSDFICKKLAKKMKAIEPIKKKHSKTMPKEDYRRYIEPYESRKTSLLQ